MAYILIVEDESIAAEALAEQLMGFGYNIVGKVATAKEAIEKTEELQPDSVLMDIFLQGDTDGIEATRQIRTKFNIPVVYLTAYSDSVTIERLLSTNPDGYVLKPSSPQQLKATIEIALQ